MNDFFNKCNMIINAELQFMKNGETIEIPFIFHIKDIDSSFDEKVNYLEFYGKNIYFSNEVDRKRNMIMKYLSFVDLNQFTIEENIDGLTRKYLNNYVFKDTESLYLFLINYLKFTEVDFIVMKEFIFSNQIKLVSNYVSMIEKALEIGSGTDNPSEGFMLLRCAYELNHTAPVFPENTGRAISEFSFRELRMQRIYMGRKCEIEKIQYDNIMKKNKKETKL